jgi:hypothetical protein
MARSVSLVVCGVLVLGACVRAPSSARLPNERHGVCPLAGPLAVRDAPEPFMAGVLLISDGGGPVRSGLPGMIERVRIVEDGPTADVEITVRSGDLTLTYGRGGASFLPREGQEIEAGETMGLGTDMLWMQASRAGEPLDLRLMLEEWGCRESLPEIRELRARLLDGSDWVVELAEPILVAGAQTVGTYGSLVVDGKVVADVSRWRGMPDLNQPEFSDADPPELLDRFPRRDGKRAELWNMAPNSRGTLAYLLWIEGDGDHVRITSSIPPEEAELIATTMQFEEMDQGTGAVWFESERTSIEDLEAVFFLTDPADPLRGPQIRLASSCRAIDPSEESRCSKITLQGPILTHATRKAVELATVRRVGCGETEMVRRPGSEESLGEDGFAFSINTKCG